jgi:hypothetical protein
VLVCCPFYITQLNESLDNQEFKNYRWCLVYALNPKKGELQKVTRNLSFMLRTGAPCFLFPTGLKLCVFLPYFYIFHLQKK